MRPAFGPRSPHCHMHALGPIAIISLGVAGALAQSSVSVKVETTRGALVSDVKVMSRVIDTSKKKDKTKPPGSAQVDQLSESDTGQYEIDHLKKGKYRFYACDQSLSYEPDFNDVDLGESDHKKFTLVLQEQLITQPVKGVDAGSKVCLIHDETGCFALKVVDPSKTITYRGVQEHYHIEDVQACKKE